MTKKKQESKVPPYTERPDGYGSGGAENRNLNLPYEKERESKKFKQKSSTKDDFGQPNQQGEMDQFTFRD